MPSTCLVTGGAGFIGCAISADLSERFDRVVVLDNLHPQIHAEPIRPTALHSQVELVVGDITDHDVWDNLLRTVKPDVVIHLAAETGTGQSLTEGTRHADVNVRGTTQMLDAFVRNEAVPSRIVLTSSRAVYGEGAWIDQRTNTVAYPGQRSKAMLEDRRWDFPGMTCLPYDASTTVPHPTSIYGSTKLAQEHILRSWALSFGVDTPILRLQNVYGPGQSLTNPYTGIVPLFARIAREGRSIPIYEDGEIIRDFVFIDDVAAAILLVVGGSAPSLTPYDIGSGAGTSIMALGSIIAKLHNAPAPHINGAYRNGDVRCASCNISRATVDLGWTPKWSVETGVETLCRWIADQAGPTTSMARAS